MENQSKNKIQVTTNKLGNIYGISIPLDYKNASSLSKINYHFIRYKGIVKISEKNNEGIEEIVNKHFIEFVNFPLLIIKDICEIIQERIDEFNQKESVDEVIKELVNLFSKTKFSDRERKKFIGDFGEALFILKVKKELNLDISNYYRSNEDLFDFYVPEKKYFMEVKSCQKANGRIIINQRQIEESEERDFYVVEFQFVPENKNILDIYNEINSTSPIIKDKIDYWKHWSGKQESQEIILKRNTVDFNNVLVYKLRDEFIPKIKMNNIINGQAIEKIEITLNVAHSRSEGFGDLKNILTS